MLVSVLNRQHLCSADAPSLCEVVSFKALKASALKLYVHWLDEHTVITSSGLETLHVQNKRRVKAQAVCNKCFQGLRLY